MPQEIETIDVSDRAAKGSWVQVLSEGLKALGAGFFTTLRHLFRKPITESYPEYKRPLPARSRARIVLTRDPDGEERCVACFHAVGRERGRSALRGLVPDQFRALYILRPV